MKKRCENCQYMIRKVSADGRQEEVHNTWRYPCGAIARSEIATLPLPEAYHRLLLSWPKVFILPLNGQSCDFFRSIDGT